MVIYCKTALWRAIARVAWLLALAGGCAEADTLRDPAGGGQLPERKEDSASVFVGRTYQRTIAFMDPSGETPAYVSWEFWNREEPEGLERTVRGWLGRAGAWALFIEDPLQTGPSRAPWRVVVRPPVELVMEYGDVLREIHYQDGLRSLSLRLGDPVREWRGRNKEMYRLLRGTARVSGEEANGLVLDVTAIRSNQSVRPTEWALLTGGRRLQVLVAGSPGAEPYQAWARYDSTTLSWENVEVTWDETRRFERANRDIPVLWRIESRNRVLSGSFSAVSSHFKTIDRDDGPMSVLGVYEVEGEVSIRGISGPVRGFLRHSQH